MRILSLEFKASLYYKDPVSKLKQQEAEVSRYSVALVYCRRYVAPYIKSVRGRPRAGSQLYRTALILGVMLLCESLPGHSAYLMLLGLNPELNAYCQSPVLGTFVFNSSKICDGTFKTPVLKKWRYEDQEFKVFLSLIHVQTVRHSHCPEEVTGLPWLSHRSAPVSETHSVRSWIGEQLLRFFSPGRDYICISLSQWFPCVSVRAFCAGLSLPWSFTEATCCSRGYVKLLCPSCGLVFESFSYQHLHLWSLGSQC